MKEKRFVFLMHLGANMWQKPGNARGYKKESIDWLYRDYLVTDDSTWKTVTDFLPGCKINTLLIDMGEAAGTAAALCTEGKVRSVNMELLKKTLSDNGAIVPSRDLFVPAD